MYQYFVQIFHVKLTTILLESVEGRRLAPEIISKSISMKVWDPLLLIVLTSLRNGNIKPNKFRILSLFPHFEMITKLKIILRTTDKLFPPSLNHIQMTHKSKIKPTMIQQQQNHRFRRICISSRLFALDSAVKIALDPDKPSLSVLLVGHRQNAASDQGLHRMLLKFL